MLAYTFSEDGNISLILKVGVLEQPADPVSLWLPSRKRGCPILKKERPVDTQIGQGSKRRAGRASGKLGFDPPRHALSSAVQQAQGCLKLVKLVKRARIDPLKACLVQRHGLIDAKCGQLREGGGKWEGGRVFVRIRPAWINETNKHNLFFLGYTTFAEPTRADPKLILSGVHVLQAIATAALAAA